MRCFVGLRGKRENEVIKMKPIIVSASLAFVLSFFTALVAKTGVPFSLLKAFVFAVIFGGLAAGIQFVYGKFLLEGAASVSEAETQPRTLGSKVDLVVSEEDLPGDGDALTFSFDNERHVLTSEDVGYAAQNDAVEKRAPVSESAASVEGSLVSQESVAADGTKPSAKPLEADEKKVPPLAVKPSPDTAAIESVSADAKVSAVAQGSFDALPELDNLPDFGMGASASGENGEDGDDGVIEDSDFAEEGGIASARQTEFSDGTVADTKDASLMAQAIRTVLAHEE